MHVSIGLCIRVPCLWVPVGGIRCTAAGITGWLVSGMKLESSARAWQTPPS